MPGMFTEEQRAVMYEGAETLGGILKDRFYAKQAEDFMQNEMQIFNQRTADFFNSLPALETGDMLGQEFMKYSNEVLSPFITNASVKYGKNERIMTIVKGIMDMNTQQMKNFIEIRQDVREQAESERMAGREPFIREEMAAGAEAQREAAATSRVRRGLMLREAEAAELPALGPQTDIASARAAVRSVRKNNPEEYNRIAADTQDKLRASIMTRNIGKPKGYGDKEWGEDREEDIVDANIVMAQMPADIKQKAIEANALLNLGYPAGNLQASGVFDEVLPYVTNLEVPAPAERVPKMRAGTTTQAIHRAMAQTPEDIAARGVVATGSIKEFGKSVAEMSPMQGLHVFGPHIQGVFEGTFDRNEAGQTVATIRGERYVAKNFQDVRRMLAASWEEEVVRGLYGEDAPMLQSDMRQMGRILIDKFAPQIAARYGLRPKKAPKEDLGITEWLEMQGRQLGKDISELPGTGFLKELFVEESGD